MITNSETLEAAPVLSRRDEFAKAALVGLFSSDPGLLIKDAVELSVECADALIAELDKDSDSDGDAA